MNFLCWFYNSVFASTVFMHVFSYVFILLQSSLYQKGSSIIQSNANLQLPLYALISRQQGVNITGDQPKGPESHLQVWGLGSFLRARTSGYWFSVWYLGSCLRIQGLWTCLTVRVSIFAVYDSSHGPRKEKNILLLWLHSY